jgi:hypothetical protein
MRATSVNASAPFETRGAHRTAASRSIATIGTSRLRRSRVRMRAGASGINSESHQRQKLRSPDRCATLFSQWPMSGFARSIRLR